MCGKSKLIPPVLLLLVVREEEDTTPLVPYLDPFIKAACEAAAEFVEGLEENTSGVGRVNLKDTFDDLVGNKKSGLDGLSYSSDEDDKL